MPIPTPGQDLGNSIGPGAGANSWNDQQRKRQTGQVPAYQPSYLRTGQRRMIPRPQPTAPTTRPMGQSADPYAGTRSEGMQSYGGNQGVRRPGTVPTAAGSRYERYAPSSGLSQELANAQANPETSVPQSPSANYYAEDPARTQPGSYLTREQETAARRARDFQTQHYQNPIGGQVDANGNPIAGQGPYINPDDPRFQTDFREGPNYTPGAYDPYSMQGDIQRLGKAAGDRFAGNRGDQTDIYNRFLGLDQSGAGNADRARLERALGIAESSPFADTGAYEANVRARQEQTTKDALRANAEQMNAQGFSGSGAERRMAEDARARIALQADADIQNRLDNLMSQKAGYNLQYAGLAGQARQMGLADEQLANQFGMDKLRSAGDMINTMSASDIDAAINSGQLDAQTAGAINALLQRDAMNTLSAGQYNAGAWNQNQRENVAQNWMNQQYNADRQWQEILRKMEEEKARREERIRAQEGRDQTAWQELGMLQGAGTGILTAMAGGRK